MRRSGTKSVAASVVAALFIAPLSAVAVVGLLRYQDACHEGEDAAREDAAREPVELAALLGPTAWARSALASEMAWQATRIAGTEDLVDMPGPDSVRQTDEAIAAAGAAAGSAEAEALATATDAFAGLGDVRAEADAIVGSGVGAAPRSARIDAGMAMEDRYTLMLDAYDAELAEAASGFDDPDLRLAATLSLTASGLTRDVGSLAGDLLLAGVVGSGTIDHPAEAAELAAGRADVAAVRAELEAAPAPYDAVVADADHDAFDELLAHVDAAVAGEPIVPPHVLVPLAHDAVLTLDREIVAAYDMHAAAAASVAVDADTDANADGEGDDGDRTRALALAVAGALGALLAVAVVIVGATRLRRGAPTGPPAGGWPPPPPPPPPPGGQGTPSGEATVPSPPAGSA
jgi:hypothetical protein